MLGIFEWLSKILYANSIIALLGSFTWGVLSIILSPCHLTSIPLIIGFINGQGKVTTFRALLLSSSFAVGILFTIGVIGLITGMLGRILGDVGPVGNYIVAIVFFIVGIYLLDIIPITIPGLTQINLKKRGLLAAFILGLVFGVALGPCTFAYMAPMLAIVFSLGATKLLFAATLILAYAIGHCFVIIFAGTFTEVIQRYLHWDATSRGTVIVKRICGILVILGGCYLIWTTWR